MMKRLLLSATLLFAPLLLAQSPTPDGELMGYINSIAAIDDHAHVTALDRAGDKGYDQLRCDELPGGDGGLLPAMLRFGPDKQAVFETLYGFHAKDGSDAEMKDVDNLRNSALHKFGPDSYKMVLQSAGVGFVLANRTEMPAELRTEQFRWVPYEDALLFPLDNSALKTSNPDRKVLFGMAESLLDTYMRAAALTHLPVSFNMYLDKVVRATIQNQRHAGAVAIKFEVAYLRALDFAPASRDDATRIYEKYVKGGTASAAEYKTLQDYLFKFIAFEAGSVNMPVQIHTGGGCGNFFELSGADAMLLSPILNDPGLRNVNFVLLHGNGPRERSISTLITKPNVYADMSVLEFMQSPGELARVLRPWLESMPEHVMYGSDAGPFGPGLEWQETTVLGAQKMRRALALTLTGMVDEGVITPARAREIADLVLRGNAAQLYHVK
jgi:uncharacterized protein